LDNASLRSGLWLLVSRRFLAIDSAQQPQGQGRLGRQERKGGGVRWWDKTGTERGTGVRLGLTPRLLAPR
jgi:hypothetical protein